MKSLFILLIFTGLTTHAQSTSSTKAATSKKSSTQLYEQEEEKDKSFTAKVRVVREVSGDMEVFFESDDAKGAYSLPRSIENFATVLKNLEKSRAPQGPQVTVTADSDKNIKSVQLKEEKKQKAAGPTYEVPDF